ncbi:MAG TPA: 16S rRNA (cytosine(1402)-N(4))-methyltransferase RsmH [Candidatus Binataceae bacterium]|nr:16S rRNA (cytosine(1402)-N(4))-methyltransferase RsmH [Candidatus Binataceae bacterium]
MSFAAMSEDGADRVHVPVMAAEAEEILSALSPSQIVDVTLGGAGHASRLLEASPRAKLFGIDQDAAAIEIAREALAKFDDRVTLVQANFADISSVMREAGLASADAILADLGMSSLALDDPARGFSFRLDGPLDMRMDQRATLRAYDIVNEETEAELARMFREYGEERMPGRIARTIVEARRKRRIETTGELRALVERAIGPHRRGGVHPATRTFQALRIAVNHELESLEKFLRDAPAMLAPGGRLAVIAYHSLEDRMVKERFRELGRSGEYNNLTKKVIKPTNREIAQNPRSRSARLRCLERRPA